MFGKKPKFPSKEYFGWLVDASPFAIISTDLHGRIISFNKTAEQMYGYREEEVLGKHARLLQPGNSKQELNREIYQAILKKDGWDGELLNVRKSGEVFPVYLRTRRIVDERGVTLGLLSFAQDISERKKLEHEVKLSTEFLRGIVEGSADAIVTTSLSGEIMFWNRGAEELYGYPAKEVMGKSVLELYPQELREERMRWVEALLSGATIRNKRTKLRSRSGELRDISLSLSLLRDENGTPIATVGVSKDITNELRLERELQNYAKSLEEKNREMESFLYSISHDLKSPVISIHGFSAALLKEHAEKLGEEARFYIERIKKNAELMERLISDLLELSRIGRVTHTAQKVDLRMLVSGICEDMGRRSKEKKISFVVGELPVVHCEKDRITQLFINLIDNAVKYIGSPEEPKIEVACEDKGDEWQFYVRDNGIGIPREYHAKLFQMFERIPGEGARDIAGTGLGLAIVKKIVELHRGRVWVESEVGKGSTFYFTLPKNQKGGKE